MKLTDVTKVLNLQARIKKNAQALDGLTTGALVAFTAGSTVIGIVFGGLVWIPAAMSGALLGFRAFLRFSNRRQNQLAELRDELSQLALQMEGINKAALTDEQRKQLSAPIQQQITVLRRDISKLGSIDRNRKLLR
jgi:hypothetical protein